MGNPSATINLPLDTEGFFSRECPSCERRFKIAPGKGSPNPLAFCPYCRHNGLDCWWTPEQIAYANDQAARLADGVIGPELDRVANDINRSRRRGSFLDISMKVTRLNRQPPVAAPDEPTDPMDTVRFACCGEDVKVVAGVPAAHCIICGAAG